MKGCLESSLLPSYMVGVHPSEEGRPTGCADLLHVVLSQSDPGPGQPGEGPRHVSHGLVVPADVSPPEVVRQHHHDVGWAGPQHWQPGQQEEEGDTALWSDNHGHGVTISQCYNVESHNITVPQCSNIQTS